MNFKTKISFSYILAIVIIFLIATQIKNFIHLNFFNNQSWINYFLLLLYAVLFNLLFVWSFELNSSFLKVNYTFFLRKSKFYYLKDINAIKIFNLHGKRIPYLEIKLKEKKYTHYFLLINNKSMNEMAFKLKDYGINVTIFNKPSDFT
jgi:hypothetical protein